MKTLTELTEAINENVHKTSQVRNDYELQIAKLSTEKAELITIRALLLADLNLNYIKIAEEILSIQGNVSNVCENQKLTDLAVNDILAGCPHMKKEFYGNKKYDGYYQRTDCQYGYGPKHGSIVESVGLQSDRREAKLTEAEKEACIYYLLNFQKIRSAKMEVTKF